MLLLKLSFAFSLFMICYIYIGYPLAVFLTGTLRNKKVKKDVYHSPVTIIIAAYNEERNIRTTLRNKFELDYPKEQVEIIVVSDGSTDKTEDIVKEYAKEGVRLLRQEPRAGKTAAINMAVPEANGEILVFSDANSLYATDALTKLVENFHDPGVGYVTGRMIYTNPDDTTIGDGCTTYMKYENFVRHFETKLGSIVGVDGGIDAVRKDQYSPMNPDQLIDFVLPLKVVEQGYRVVYEPRAILREPALKAAKDEYRMRLRVSLRALWALSDMRQLLSLKKFKLFAWQLWSHKVLRYLCFIFLLGAYFSNIALLHLNTFYKTFFILQNIAYLAAIASPLLEKQALGLKLLYLLNYFLLLNLAAGHAFLKFLFRQKQVVWTPRKG